MTQPAPKPKKVSLRTPSPDTSRAITFPEGVDFEGDLKIKSAESNSDRLHRHRMEIRRYWTQEVPANLTALAIILGCTVLALVWAFRPGSAPDDKKWAVSVLSYLLVATAGFAFGKVARFVNA